MTEPDRLERAAAAMLAEPIPPTLSPATVQQRAGAIRRRHRIVSTAAACVVVLLAGSLALNVRRSSTVSVTVDDPAARVSSHTYRYRFATEADEATRRATVDRLVARYRALGDEVTAEMVSDTEFSITDNLPASQSSQVAQALSFVGATSLRGVTQDLGVPAQPKSADPASTVPGPDASCPTGSLPQWEPPRKLLAGCYAVGDELAVSAGDGALASAATLAATASSGTMDVQVNGALQEQLAALQAACAARAAACPLGTIALVLDETVAGMAPAHAVAPPAGQITLNGLFNQQVGPWLGAILRTGKLPVAVIPVTGSATASSTTTTVR